MTTDDITLGNLAIMCGLPRSGKTTYAKRLQSQGWVRICPDDFRLALHGQAFLAKAERQVWATIDTTVRALLLGDQRVVIDATNTTRKGRAQWVDMAAQFDGNLTIFLIDTPLALCQDRNKGKGAVPGDVLLRMAGKFEPPTRFEGRVLIPVEGVGYLVPYEFGFRSEGPLSFAGIRQLMRDMGGLDNDH